MSTRDETQHAETTMRAPVLWCLAAAALFGASTPMTKALLGPMGPLLLSGLLACIAWGLDNNLTAVIDGVE